MATALPWAPMCSRRRAAHEGCPDAPYYRTRGVPRGRREGEDELGVENSTQTYCRLLKNRGLSLSVHFYIILPATLFNDLRVIQRSGLGDVLFPHRIDRIVSLQLYARGHVREKRFGEHRIYHSHTRVEHATYPRWYDRFDRATPADTAAD